MSDNIEASKSSNEENPDDIYTLHDLLKEQEEIEEQCAAVLLGGSNGKECTYEKGYIKRQALYSCLTCCPEGKTDEKKVSGICLACSYRCHENHELVELYTKRNFRCDCPTEKIPNIKCTFIKNDSCNEFSSSSCGSSSSSNNENKKYPINKENIYNQNFTGVYCICKKPYPDQDDSIDDEMIQCILCEDWYHTRHLNATVPKSETYSEMICGDCMQTYDFLKDYTGYAVNKIEKNEINNTVDVINAVTTETNDVEEDDKLKSELDKSISDIMSISKNNTDEDETNDIAGTSEIDYKPSAKKSKLDRSTDSVSGCKRPNGKCYYDKGAVFWIHNWRQNLCTCNECIELYTKNKIDYLLDKEDTLQFYEQNGLNDLQKLREFDLEKEIFSKLNRVQQIEAITEYNKLKEKLGEFLHSFAINQKVVTEADVRRFFQEMKNEKNSYLGVPHFCR